MQYDPIQARLRTRLLCDWKIDHEGRKVQAARQTGHLKRYKHGALINHLGDGQHHCLLHLLHEERLGRQRLGKIQYRYFLTAHLEGLEKRLNEELFCVSGKYETPNISNDIHRPGSPQFETKAEKIETLARVNCIE